MSKSFQTWIKNTTRKTCTSLSHLHNNPHPPAHKHTHPAFISSASSPVHLKNDTAKQLEYNIKCAPSENKFYVTVINEIKIKTWDYRLFKVLV